MNTPPFGTGAPGPPFQSMPPPQAAQSSTGPAASPFQSMPAMNSGPITPGHMDSPPQTFKAPGASTPPAGPGAHDPSSGLSGVPAAAVASANLQWGAPQLLGDPFSTLDRDQDGVLTREEFERAIVPAVGGDASPSAAAGLPPTSGVVGMGAAGSAMVDPFAMPSPGGTQANAAAAAAGGSSAFAGSGGAAAAGVSPWMSVPSTGAGGFMPTGPGGPPSQLSGVGGPQAGGLPPTAGMAPPFGGPGSGVGGPGIPSSALSRDLTVYITRLLDMPMEENLLGQTKAYTVRALDMNNRSLDRTEDIPGLPASLAGDMAVENIEVPQHLGRISLVTESPLIYLQVEHANLLPGTGVIGRCQIHRMDPRSAQVWPYALSDRNGNSANCGIELWVQEGPPVPGGMPGAPGTPRMSMAPMDGSMLGAGHSPFATHTAPEFETRMPMPPPSMPMAPGGPVPMGPPMPMGPGASMATMVPPMGPPMMPPMGMMPPGSMGSIGPSMMPPTSMPMGMPGAPLAVHEADHQLVALLEIDKVTDLPYPRNPAMDHAILTISSQVYGRDSKIGGFKELRRVGPFKVSSQSERRQLAMADCAGTKVQVQGPLHLGHTAGNEGAMVFKVTVSYVTPSNPSHLDFVGEAEGVRVTFRQARSKYYELRRKDNMAVLGGVTINHRLLTEAEAEKQGLMEKAQRPPRAQLQTPVPINTRVNGRTGNFPKGHPMEALEQAAINAEAQNRAMLQRCKKADPEGSEEPGQFRWINGYREWESLDTLFWSMGPNPMTFSDEVGPSVTRGYQDITNVMKEVAPKLQPSAPVDELILAGLYPEDAYKVKSTIRPVICKDPKEIAFTKDMSWCPDPPVYVPTRCLTEQDKETMQLACYEPVQCAKLRFADVNPNYVVGKDIWGVLHDYKKSDTMLLPKPEFLRRRRVKDECIMA